MRVKICGITQPEQARAIVRSGATALGFICVPASPRYVTPAQIAKILEYLNLKAPAAQFHRIGVFANATLAEVQQTVQRTRLSGVQLHGAESPTFCADLRTLLPTVEILKALRIRTEADLAQAKEYQSVVDTFLLDAYHPNLLGGTGKTLDWQTLAHFHPGRPWFLAGGLTPDNILIALQQVHPDGIDLSSGVEHSPGDKDLCKVAVLFERLQARLINQTIG